MYWWSQKKTQKIISVIFLFSLILQGMFFAFESVAQAQSIDRQIDQQARSTNTSSDQVQTDSGGGWLTSIGGAFKDVFIWLFKQIYSFLAQYMATPAAGIFVFAVNPNNISGPNGVLNLPAVYSLWQFIRDFFNLFFILILLFSAFATIFQVESFNIRNVFKNVLLVALLINFSFPITRFLIDLVNVPMYYLINDVLGDGSTSGGVAAMNALLGYSGVSSTAFVVPDGDDITKVIMAVVFIFLFAISLLVLSVMMLIRLVALTLLLIFSPFGFASSLFPGLGSFGRDWWSKFWNYALFGPAAALMLVVAIRFLEAVYQGGTTWSSINEVATNMSTGSGASSAITQVVFFTIPLILIWSAIGMANKFSIAGAAAVTGYGYSAARKAGNYVRRGSWGATKFVGRTAAAPAKPIARGVAAGLKDFPKSGKLFGNQVLPKGLTGKAFQQRSENAEARAKGFVTGGRKGAASEVASLETKRQQEAAKGMSNSELLKLLSGGDKLKATVAAKALTERGAIKSMGDFQKALTVLGKDTKEVGELISKAEFGDASSLMPKDYQAILSSEAFKEDSELKGAFEGKLKSQGEIKARVDYEASKNKAENPNLSEADAKRKAYTEVLTKLSGDDLAKQSSLIQGANTDPELKQYFKEMANNQKVLFERVLASKELKGNDLQTLISIQKGGGSSARQEAEAAFQPRPQNPTVES